MHGDRTVRGAASVAVAGAAWAVLCLVLAADGHAPSVTLVPIPREHYYLAQAAFVLPLLLAQWGLCVAATQTVAKALGGRGEVVPTANGLGLALAAPLLLLFLLPDAVAYAVGGFAWLGPLVRVTSPLAFVATIGVATVVVRVGHGLARGRAFVAALAGVVVQAALGGVLLR